MGQVWSQRADAFCLPTVFQWTESKSDKQPVTPQAGGPCPVFPEFDGRSGAELVHQEQRQVGIAQEGISGVVDLAGFVENNWIIAEHSSHANVTLPWPASYDPELKSVASSEYPWVFTLFQTRREALSMNAEITTV